MCSQTPVRGVRREILLVPRVFWSSGTDKCPQAALEYHLRGDTADACSSVQLPGTLYSCSSVLGPRRGRGLLTLLDPGRMHLRSALAPSLTCASCSCGFLLFAVNLVRKEGPAVSHMEFENEAMDSRSQPVSLAPMVLKGEVISLPSCPAIHVSTFPLIWLVTQPARVRTSALATGRGCVSQVC